MFANQIQRGTVGDLPAAGVIQRACQNGRGLFPARGPFCKSLYE